MGDGILEGLLKIGGLAGLSVGVFYLLYKQILGLGLFRQLSQRQTFVTIGLVVALVWLLAMTALIVRDEGFRAFVIGDGNVVQQGGT